ncbi:hypothetical protein [Amaricoccus sp.]|uniref:hypothetical protein n=1 Tax=Amaricoccus sp. TaxID=1872485 RepID=UPI001B766FD0|nr:hypothetical protein [Amaricoccus sp.]MBP7001303.1 hypothetical protein [Amaricoccus sp.]
MKREARSAEDTFAHWVRSAPDKVATYFGSLADFARPLRPEELAAADRITTAVLPLGPYRNLTTMTAALFALHPQAVVLNHAADRVFASRHDPFDAPGPERWRAFKAVALRLLRHGRKSSYGGNVLLSHAFRGRPIEAAYRARFGDVLAKPEATTLFWKDSMRFQNRFEAGRPSVEAFLAAVPETVFLFPVRNPMDCARSNLATGHVRHLLPEDQRTFDATLRRVLESLRWFRARERADPERFWSFTEAELGGDFFARFAAFARLPADPAWLADAPGAVEIAPRSEHKPGRPELYARLVAELFADDPAMRARLERFLD